MPSSKLSVSSVNGKLTARRHITPYYTLIAYAYDWLHDAPYLDPKTSLLPLAGYERLQQCRFPSTDGGDEPTDGFPKARQSRHWEAGLRISSELLELFSTDSSMFTAVKLNGRGPVHQVCHVPVTEADKERTRLLAATIVFIVIFDDSWEMHSEDKLGVVRDDFLRRLESNGEKEKSKVRTEIAGNGGQEVNRLADFCQHVPPKSNFASLADYLSYRNIDAGVPPDPHLTINFNDLASFDKELKVLEDVKVCYMIDAVDVVRRLLGLATYSAAKAVTYSVQLEVEAQMEEEL
ncbi:hypothetical protein CSAL01_06766 [Colletotrichum salicis]|uniref:Uncharacterized protein n=1 Tax=Colletotrichum salicis TaxID=1209931 RepID=A0A135U5E6_9PEZI|nr:hypothetical protein CSAL01_06766 [Colletotrichum salicis]